jgi:F-type H+-transporting ATPase subunit b
MKQKIGICFLFLLLTVTFCYGSGEEGDHGGGWHFDWNKTLSSIILFGGLYYLLRKPIKKFMGKKGEAVKEDIQQREREIEEREAQFKKIRERLGEIESEVSSLKDGARERGEKEKKRIEEMGETESRRIIALTEAEIQQKVESSIKELKSKIADMTIEHFKESIGKELDQKTHDKIIKKNTDLCGEINERD